MNGEIEKFDKPLELGKIIIDDHMEWRYEGESVLPEEDIENIARMVLAEER